MLKLRDIIRMLIGSQFSFSAGNVKKDGQLGELIIIIIIIIIINIIIIITVL